MKSPLHLSAWLFLLYGMTFSPNLLFANIPIKIISKLPVIRATVDGVEGNYILDTGASHLFLNRKYFSGWPTDRVLHGIHGESIEVEMIYVNFKLGSIENKSMYSELIPMNLVERALGIPVMGLVGASTFRNCEIVIDYVNSELSIHQVDRKGNRLDYVPPMINEPPPEVMPCKFKRYMPCIEATIHGQSILLGFDSGAGVNVWDENRSKNIDLHKLNGENQNIAGVGVKVRRSTCFYMSGISMGNNFCRPMKTALISLKKINRDLAGSRLNGIVGYELLVQYRVAINFRKKEIYLWDHFTQPQRTELAAVKSTVNKIEK